MHAHARAHARTHASTRMQVHIASTLLEAQLQLPRLHNFHFVSLCSHLEHVVRAS